MSKLTDYKILIAEDEESLAMLIDYNLIKNGYKVFPVKPNESGKKILGLKCFDSLESIKANIDMVDVFRAKIVDITDQSLIVESTGSSSKIDAMEKLFNTIGLKEMVRSGKLVMARGTNKT